MTTNLYQVLAIAGGLLFASCTQTSTQTTNQLGFAEVGEFSVMKYKVSQIVGQRDSSVWNMFGEKEILFRINAYVEVGIDATRIKVTDSITYVPHCNVLHVDIPQDQIECIYQNVSGISSEFTQAEIIEIQQKGEVAVRHSISNYPLLTDGDVLLMKSLGNYFNNVEFYE